MKRLKFLTWLLAFIMTCGGLWGQGAPAKTAQHNTTYTTNNKHHQVAPAQKQHEDQKEEQAQEQKQQVTYKVRPWAYGNLKRHWEKHREEFPEYKTEQDYRDGALEFFRHPPEGTLFKTNENKDRLYYHPKSNTFGVTTATGVPKTLFRPDAGIKYWNRQ